MSRRLPQIVDRDDFDRLLAAPSRSAPTGVRNAAVLAAMYDTGLRVAEVCDLSPQDVIRTGSAAHTLRVRRGKGGHDRFNLGVPSPTWALLDRWAAVRPSCRYFFSTLAGNRLEERYLRAMVARYSERAGVWKPTPEGPRPINPHMLRHSYATRLIDAGVPIHDVQRALGHASLATTQRYLHVTMRSSPNGFARRSSRTEMTMPAYGESSGRSSKLSSVPPDDLSDRLRSALESPEPEAESSSATPLEQLRDLAEHASSETVRVQALKVVLDREDARREEGRRRRAEAPSPPCEECRRRTEQDAIHTPERAAGIARVLTEIGGLVPVLIAHVEHSPDAAGLLGEVARQEAESLSRVEGEIARRTELRARELVTAARPELPEPEALDPQLPETDAADPPGDAPAGLTPSDLARGFPSGRPRRRPQIGA
jgi:hypothetical protein